MDFDAALIIQTNQDQELDAQKLDAQKLDVEKQEAWVLRAGAELWKAVVLEAECPADDTRKALTAVRRALDCARRLRHATGIPDAERCHLESECKKAVGTQILALRQWGQGRGLHWDDDFGTRWGQALSSCDDAPNPLSSDQPSGPSR